MCGWGSWGKVGRERREEREKKGKKKGNLCNHTQRGKILPFRNFAFTFQIQWILGKINDLSYTIIVMLKPFQKYPPTL